ncbi:MAG: hypothetical protein HS115_01470 [Spirochaetales bacterium]|nr:hypothetical protein [Spirochaetales bacterium]
MEMYLARAWGLYLTLIAISLIINRKALRQILKAAGKGGFIYLSGFMALCIGILQVLSYNVWVADWNVILTVLGWVSLLKGILIFLWPGYARRSVEHFRTGSLKVYLGLLLILGVFLLYRGFFAVQIGTF